MEPEVLSYVPPQLKKLVRLVVRAFYQPEHYIVMDILARYPCVNETDLLELLKLEPKKLRVIILYLKKDKLIKCVQRMESKQLENGEKKSYLSHYYYINYKVFVNVVKFKMDRMRERIQAEERTVSNRTSYICPGCQNTYSDLDVDRLLDPVEGILRCFMCRTQLQEDSPQGNVIDARSVLIRLNEQLKPILELLREMENVSLAEHILDPEPQSIQNLIQDNKYEKNKSQHGKGNWAANKIDDIYGDQTFSINIGSENDLKGKATQKVAPQWMKESTVYESVSAVDEKGDKDTVSTSRTTVMPGDEIMKLLANEEHKKVDRDSSSSSEGDTSSDEDMEEQIEKPKTITLQDEVSNVSSNEEEDSDDDDDTLKVGDKEYQLTDITPDVIAIMTPSEKEKYAELYQQAYNNFY